MARPRKNWDEILNDEEKPITSPKIPGAEPCIEGRARHSYGADGKCAFCGYERKSGASTTRSFTRSQPTRSTSGSTTAIPAPNLKDAREGMAFVLLLAQKVLIMRVPELKDDELNPLERQLLAAALTEELYESIQVRRFLAKLSQQKKHAKLSMVTIAILLPRLKRHGIIPPEMDLDEIQGELVNNAVQSTSRQPETSTSSGPRRSPSDEPDFEWDSVPVAAGGSPISNRGNGFGEIHSSGMADETTPLRRDSEDEAGRYSVAGASGGEIPSSNEESTVKSYRVAPRPETDRPEKG